MAYLYDMEKKDKAEPKPGAPEAVEVEEVEVEAEVEEEVVKVEKKAIKSAPHDKAMQPADAFVKTDKVETYTLGGGMK